MWMMVMMMMMMMTMVCDRCFDMWRQCIKG